MVIEKDIGALGNIPNKKEEYTQMAGDVVPMLDPFIYIEMLLKQGYKPLDTIIPMKEIFGTRIDSPSLYWSGVHGKMLLKCFVVYQ